MGYSLPEDASDRLRALRAAVAARMGDGEAPCAAVTVPRVATGWASVDGALGGGLPCAGLHEWWGDPADARAVCAQLAWNALLADERARPGAHRHVAWVGRAAWPAPEDLVRGLRSALGGMFGAPRVRCWPDARLHDRSILVDVPAHDAGARLWAIEQAARCAGVCTVVADGHGFDLAATRRLQLAATDVLLLSLRGPARRGAGMPAGAGAVPPSACSTRWRVERVPASQPGAVPGATSPAERAPWIAAWLRDGAVPPRIAAQLPAEPAWHVTLERAKGQAMQLEAACTVHAVRSLEWEGAAAPPAPVAAAERRRSERSERLRGERAAARLARRRADELALDAEHAAGGADGTRTGIGTGIGTGSGTGSGAGAALPLETRHARGRARDRMTSRGERWAHEVAGNVDAHHDAGTDAGAGVPHAMRRGASRAG
jgi:protein ImuA